MRKYLVIAGLAVIAITVTAFTVASQASNTPSASADTSVLQTGGEPNIYALNVNRRSDGVFTPLGIPASGRLRVRYAAHVPVPREVNLAGVRISQCVRDQEPDPSIVKGLSSGRESDILEGRMVEFVESVWVDLTGDFLDDITVALSTRYQSQLDGWQRGIILDCLFWGAEIDS